jgi:aminotransferase
LAQLAIKHNIYILSDEVYKDFLYDTEEKLYSLAELRGIRDRLVYIFSFSKAYAMTGWRIAFLTTHENLAKKILAVHDALVTCAPVVSQFAAMGALEMAETEVLKFKEYFRKRRDLTCQRLDKLKHIFEYQKPDSAYFVFPRIKEEILQKIAGDGGSWQFAIELLEKAKLATVPGVAFGPSGENHIRMCFGRSEEDINTAFDRLEKFFNKNFS